MHGMTELLLIHSEVSQHRTRELAERKRRRLERKYPPPDYVVRIALRRDSRGRFSSRGKSFTFRVYEVVQIEPEEPENEEDEDDIEYGGAFDSPDSGRSKRR